MFKLITEKRLQDVDDNLYTYPVYGNDLLLQTFMMEDTSTGTNNSDT